MKAPSVSEYIESLKAADNDTEQIKTIASALFDALSSGVTEGTLGNKLTPYNKAVKAAFPAESLKPDVNAYLFERKGGLTEIRHKHFQFTTNQVDWNSRNATSDQNIEQRLDNPAIVYVDPYLATMIDLLDSQNDYDLAAGLIAASGRRSIEIWYLGQFAKTNDPYKVKFKGQAKRRDYDSTEKPEYEIRLLIPSDAFLKLWRQLKKTESYKDLAAALKAKALELGDIPTDQREVALRAEYHKTKQYKGTYRAVQNAFDKTGIFENLENISAKKKDPSVHILRHACVNLIVQRDVKSNAVGKALKLAAEQLGHFISGYDRIKDFLASVGYINFEVYGEVTTLDDAFKVTRVRIDHADLDRLNELGTRLNAKNQQQTLNWLLNQSDRVIQLERELANLRNQLASQQATQPAAAKVETTETAETMQNQDVEQLIDSRMKELEQRLLSALGQAPAPAQPQQTTQPTEATTAPAEVTEAAPAVDPKYQLKRAQSDRGRAAEERVNSAFWAVADYNDQQLADDSKWYVTARLLKDLTGVNYAIVKRWIALNETTIEEHNQRNGLAETHNRSHGKKGIKITDLISI